MVEAAGLKPVKSMSPSTKWPPYEKNHKITVSIVSMETYR
jgi:hypothetical protein